MLRRADIEAVFSALALLQNLRAFLAHRLEAAWIEIERIEDRRRDLSGEGGILDDLRVLDARRADHQQHVTIVVGEATVLGKLAAAGADDA